MKDVTYRFGIRQAPVLMGLAQEATKTLDEILGGDAPLISAEWDRGKGPRGSDLLVLTLSDGTDSAMRIFEPQELQSPSQRNIGLRLLWDDLLGIRSRKLLQELLSSGEAREGG
jgi:hypothetical protein